jgi:predicted PurR-regulated permease PerM
VDGQQSLFDFNPLRIAAWCVIFAVTIALLVLGKSFLVPFAIALVIWVLIAAIRSTLVRMAPGNWIMPGWLATTLALLTIVASVYIVIGIISSQSGALTAAIPVYQQNFATLAAKLSASLSFAELPTAESLLSQVDLGAILTSLGDSVTTVMSDTVLISIYVGFLLAEEKVLPSKVRHLSSDPDKAERIAALASDVSTSIQRYIGMKTVISLLTAALSYVVLILVGVDFAAIWALLVFFLNFIPTIGSILAVVFPALLALVQFDTLTPFLIVALGLGGTQFLIGNVVEPAYMGKSLNLSSLMILLSLSFWGIIWGIPGMFLSVPMMVMTAIVCAQFKGLRWMAVLLSVDGSLVSHEKNANEQR